MKHLAILLALFILKTAIGFAQQPVDSLDFQKEKMASPVEIETVVELKNGGQVRGELVEWQKGEQVIIRFRNGHQVTLPEAEIVRLKQFRYGDQPSLPDKKEYNFRENAWFGSLSIGLYPRNSDDDFGDSHKIGIDKFTFSGTIGYQESRFGGIGLGLGIDKYGSSDNMTIVPLFLDFRSYFLRKPRTPYFNMMLGHGFPAKVNFPEGSGLDISQKNGGLFISSAIGVRLGARPFGNMTVDFGWRYQKCGFTVASAGPFGSSFSRDFNYKRFTLRVGMVF